MFAGRAEKFLLLFEGDQILCIIQLKPEIISVLVREFHINFVRFG